MNPVKNDINRFIDDVIIPIEENDTDSGKLYLLVKIRPRLMGDSNNYYYAFDENDEFKPYGQQNELDWSFPIKNEPGSWIESEGIKLETISGIIWHGSDGGALYEAEYEGENRRLGYSDYFYYVKMHDDEQNVEINAAENIDRHINLGLRVKKARLTKKVKACDPYLLWSFAINCVEHAYYLQRDSNPEIYKRGIIFARAYSKYRTGRGGIELEDLIKKLSKNNLLEGSQVLEKDLRDMISEAINKAGPPVKDIGKAVLESFEIPYDPFSIASHIRTAMAVWLLGKYRDEYEYPGILDHDLESQKTLNRIWFAFHKKELDWQVNNLKGLIGD